MQANYSGISGLFYADNYLSADELAAINTQLSKISLTPISNTKNSRRTAHFGYEYNYFDSKLRPADPIPANLLKLVDMARINALCSNILTDQFNQCIINEYKPNQQISPHTDHVRNFGPNIACITIGGAAPITFTKNDDVHVITPKNGSIYIMTGESRYTWRHSLINKTNETRYSFTFRVVG
jgi:alkylated DNA repair dioxygenase AlkB